MPILGVAEGQVVSTPEPRDFTEDWLAAWNRHDIDAVLAHFDDDVVLSRTRRRRVERWLNENVTVDIRYPHVASLRSPTVLTDSSTGLTFDMQVT